MSELFTEVDEIMRQERMAKIWKENGNYIIAFVVGTILLTAAISGFRTWDTHVKTTQTAALMTLMDAPDYPANILEEDLKFRGGLRGIALLSAAGSFIADGKLEEAFALHTRAANDNSIPDDLRHLASLMRVRYLATQETIQEDLQATLQSIWNDKNSPWRFHARIEAAALYAHKAQDYTQARNMLGAVLAEPELPQTIADKAESLDHIYALKQKQTAS